MLRMDKIVIVINGEAEVGKDTLCDFVISEFYAEKISSITPIVQIAKENGWDGTKDNKSRKFLSDLKRAFIDFNNLPTTYLCKEFERFLDGENDILFVHIRESDQISEFMDKIKNACACCSLLVSDRVYKKPACWGNESDDFVDSYGYDYRYQNRKPLEDAREDFLEFFQGILDDKGVCARGRVGKFE